MLLLPKSLFNETLSFLKDEVNEIENVQKILQKAEGKNHTKNHNKTKSSNNNNLNNNNNNDKSRSGAHEEKAKEASEDKVAEKFVDNQGNENVTTLSKVCFCIFVLQLLVF